MLNQQPIENCLANFVLFRRDGDQAVNDLLCSRSLIMCWAGNWSISCTKSPMKKRSASSFPCIAVRHEYHQQTGEFGTASTHASSRGTKYTVLFENIPFRSMLHCCQVISWRYTLWF